MEVTHQSVVVTGASSGIREATALHLDEIGNVVTKALTTARPEPHDRVGPGARKMKILARPPVRLRDRLFFKTIYGGRQS
jgi:hypothetical protein